MKLTQVLYIDEQNKRLVEVFKEKATNYLERAEKLKMHLKKTEESVNAGGGANAA